MSCGYERVIFSKVNGHFEEINKNKHLTLVFTNEDKEIIKRYEELWSKIRDLIRSITKNSDDYDVSFMKIKFDFDDGLVVNKTMEIYDVTIQLLLELLKITNIIHKFS